MYGEATIVNKERFSQRMDKRFLSVRYTYVEKILPVLLCFKKIFLILHTLLHFSGTLHVLRVNCLDKHCSFSIVPLTFEHFAKNSENPF